MIGGCNSEGWGTSGEGLVASPLMGARAHARDVITGSAYYLLIICGKGE